MSVMKGDRSVFSRCAKGVKYGRVKILFANIIIKNMNPMIEIVLVA